MNAASDSSAVPLPETAEQIVPPASLTEVPRPLSKRARKRSWAELPVRIWVILAVAVALITVAFTIDKYMRGRYERWLMNEGTEVTAEIIRIRGTRDPSIAFNRTDRLDVDVSYELPGHADRFENVPGWLAQLPDQRPVPVVRPGQSIPIRVDPSSPTVWTDRTVARPWLVEFTIVWMLLPLLGVLGLIALMRRRQVLKMWQNGEVAAGVVMDLKHTAVAPLSRIVRFTLLEGGDRRVLSTLHPAKNAPQRGEMLWLVFPPHKPQKAIVARLYE